MIKKKQNITLMRYTNLKNKFRDYPTWENGKKLGIKHINPKKKKLPPQRGAPNKCKTVN